jgi:hypothetical protein
LDLGLAEGRVMPQALLSGPMRTCKAGEAAPVGEAGPAGRAAGGCAGVTGAAKGIAAMKAAANDRKGMETENRRSMAER